MLLNLFFEKTNVGGAGAERRESDERGGEKGGMVIYHPKCLKTTWGKGGGQPSPGREGNLHPPKVGEEEKEGSLFLSKGKEWRGIRLSSEGERVKGGVRRKGEIFLSEGGEKLCFLAQRMRGKRKWPDTGRGEKGGGGVFAAVRGQRGAQSEKKRKRKQRLGVTSEKEKKRKDMPQGKNPNKKGREDAILYEKTGQWLRGRRLLRASGEKKRRKKTPSYQKKKKQ